MKSNPPVSNRKTDHISLTDQAQLSNETRAQQAFYYEPLFGVHPKRPSELIDKKFGQNVLGKRLKVPLWVSSMTGGASQAKAINRHLATVAGEFGLGMGLGSCRPYLEDPKAYKDDFYVRPYMGEDGVLFANLGIAQVDELLVKKESSRLLDMVGSLEVDGLIVHLNPLQEWFQPEGDRFSRPAIETLQELLENVKVPLIVKEVGQGMGPRSLKALLSLPLVAVDFAAFGGTNFSQLELLRDHNQEMSHYRPLAHVGHDAWSMVNYVRELDSQGLSTKGPLIIVSGGVRSFLDGHELITGLNRPALYGYAKPFLDAALKGEKAVRSFVEKEIMGLAMACEFCVPMSNEREPGKWS